MNYANPLSMLQQALVSMPGGAPAPAAPSYYGPMHQQLTDYFNAGANWRADFPRYVNQLMFQPDLRAMHGGFQIRDVIAPQPNNDWRINWFPPTPEGDATKTAVAQTGGLLQPATIDTGVRAGQNDVPGGGL